VLDLIIKGGLVYDGSGTPGARCDIAVSDGRVVDMGALDDGAHAALGAVGATAGASR
jgi:N-acyl-D-aspartate/D-glutamate deacylase